MTADSSLMDLRCVVKIHHAKTLPLNEWNYLRPLQSKFDLSPMFKHVLDKESKLFASSVKAVAQVEIKNIEEAQCFVCILLNLLTKSGRSDLRLDVSGGAVHPQEIQRGLESLLHF